MTSPPPPSAPAARLAQARALARALAEDASLAPARDAAARLAEALEADAPDPAQVLALLEPPAAAPDAWREVDRSARDWIAAVAPAPRDLWHQLGHLAWLAPLLAVVLTVATTSARAANPNAAYLIGPTAAGFVALGTLCGVAALAGWTRHRRRAVALAASVGLVLALALVGVDQARHPDRHVYLGPDGLPRVYRLREPATPEVEAVLVYLHGADGTEDQGLDPTLADGAFARLHTELDRRGWAYACPRHPELTGLRDELRARYGERPLYLAGASMGGRHAFLEAARHPDRYRGVLLLCPALEEDPPPGVTLPPTWLVCGSDDPYATGRARLLAALAADVRYRELPGGDHGAPLRQVVWSDALDFLQGR